MPDRPLTKLLTTLHILVAFPLAWAVDLAFAFRDAVCCPDRADLRFLYRAIREVWREPAEPYYMCLWCASPEHRGADCPQRPSRISVGDSDG